jgi:pyruvate dehydrogenase E2 component (dihydrolipoamide acetyltransferase)
LSSDAKGALRFRLPDIGEGIDAAEILDWRVAVGDHVREDQELVEVQTDKAIVVIPCPTTGVVTELCAPAGERLAVGEVLAVIEPDGDGGTATAQPQAPSAPAQAAPGPGEKPAAPAPADPIASAAPATPARAAARPLAAPATRRRARELGVDLASVSGSGPHGRILREDVERVAAASPTADGAGPAGPGARPGDPGAPPADPAAPEAAIAPPSAPSVPARPAAEPPRPGEVIPLRGVRRAIAQTLTRAWREIPHITDYRELDASRLLEAREALRRRAGDRGREELARALTPTPLIAAAAVRALADHPYVNASVDMEREKITLHRHVHLGIATATPDGLMVPVVRDADRRSVGALALEIAALAKAARERRLEPGQLRGATFTVNNFGRLGVWLGTPIIQPPQVANLGIGVIRDQVVPVDGEPRVRPVCALSVSGDHRVLDGDTLGAFVSHVVEMLEQPLLIFEDPA